MKLKTRKNPKGLYNLQKETICINIKKKVKTLKKS